ncbi:MAG: hypothetical protein HC845_15600 [Akkermansiaceae bacterium]|nr:hypothetical protein [Akkermansiaceae bacterium]
MIPEFLFWKRSGNGDAPWSPDTHSVRLQLGPLKSITVLRFSLALISIVVGMVYPWFALPLLLLAELFERQLFFQSVQAPKMPGSFGPKIGH